MSNLPAISDFEWLVSDAATPWLERSAKVNGDQLTAFTSAIRRELSSTRTSLVLQQTAFRRRARYRFELAEQMFFTDKGLQQATDDRIADYKVSELLRIYPADSPGADLCCGIGGDLMQFAKHYAVTGYDKDEPATVFATANAALVPMQTVAADTIHSSPRSDARVADANEVDLSQVSWWHCDPDRRNHGHRTSQIALSSPSELELDEMLKRNGEGSIKLAPGATVSSSWRERSQLEWIGHRRECQQLWARFGRLASVPGQATATTLTKQGAAHKYSGMQHEVPALADSVGRYLFEPSPSIIAARLTGSLSQRLKLAAVDRSVAYLTGSALPFESITSHETAVRSLTPYEVLEILPFDTKRLKAALRAKDIGNVEVKKRGVDVDPVVLKKKLRLSGSCNAAVLLFRFQGNTLAAITQRVELDS